MKENNSLRRYYTIPEDCSCRDFHIGYQRADNNSQFGFGRIIDNLRFSRGLC